MKHRMKYEEMPLGGSKINKTLKKVMKSGDNMKEAKTEKKQAKKPISKRYVDVAKSYVGLTVIAMLAIKGSMVYIQAGREAKAALSIILVGALVNMVLSK